MKHFLWVIFFLLLNLAIWLALMNNRKPCPEPQVVSVVDTLIVIDTLTLLRWRTKRDTIRENKPITDVDSLSMSLNKLSNGM